MIAKTAISAAMPPTTPISSRTIWPEALAVPSHREEQHDHVLDGAGEDDADDDPDRARQVAHLRGQHGPDQRAGAGDGGEVVAEQHPAVGDVEVPAVLQPLGGGGALVVELQHLVGDEAGVEPVGDRVRRQRGEQDPQRGDVLTAREREHRPADGADDGDAAPDHHRLRGHPRLAAGGWGVRSTVFVDIGLLERPAGPERPAHAGLSRTRRRTQPRATHRTSDPGQVTGAPSVSARNVGRRTRRPSSGSTASTASAAAEPEQSAEAGDHGGADAAADEEEQRGDARARRRVRRAHRVTDRGAQRGLADPEREGHQHDCDAPGRARRPSGRRGRRPAGPPRRPGAATTRDRADADPGRAAGRPPGVRRARPRRWAPSPARPARPPSRGRAAPPASRSASRTTRPGTAAAAMALRTTSGLRITLTGRKPCGRRRTCKATAGAPSTIRATPATPTTRPVDGDCTSSTIPAAVPATRMAPTMSRLAPLPSSDSARQRNGMTRMPSTGSAITPRQPTRLSTSAAGQRPEAADRRGGSGQPPEREAAHGPLVAGGQDRDTERGHGGGAGALEQPGAEQHAEGRGGGGHQRADDHQQQPDQQREPYADQVGDPAVDRGRARRASARRG